MTPQQLIEAGDVLAWMSSEAEANCPLTDGRASLQAAMAIARLYLSDYAHHVIVSKLDHLAALEAVVKGDRDASDLLARHRKSLN